MSIRDVVRAERWAESAARLQQEIAAYEATLMPEPRDGWQALLDSAWEEYLRYCEEKARLYFGTEP